VRHPDLHEAKFIVERIKLVIAKRIGHIARFIVKGRPHHYAPVTRLPNGKPSA